MFDLLNPTVKFCVCHLVPTWRLAKMVYGIRKISKGKSHTVGNNTE